MNRYKRQEIIRGWDQRSLEVARVLIIGAGTTGNEVIKNLALVGVGHLTIVDSDVVEEVNLSRCVLFRQEDLGKPKADIAAKRAEELNPHVVAAGWNANAVYEIGNLQYENFDCVILTVDNLEARMWVNRYCCFNEKPLIDTGVEGLIGNVFMSATKGGPCIECGWSSGQYQRLSEKYSCLNRGLLVEERKIPMVITSAAVVGGLAAQEAVRILHNGPSGSSLKQGRFYHFDGETGSFLTWQVPVKSNCPGHTCEMKPLSVLFEVSLDDTVESIRNRVLNTIDASVVEIWYDKEIVYSATCNHCAYSQSISPCLLINLRRMLCPECYRLALDFKERTEELRDGYTLRSLHIPPRHLLQVNFCQGEITSKAWIATR